MKELGKEGAHEYHVELGKQGGDGLQAKLVAELGVDGAHKHRVELGKQGGDRLQAKLKAEHSKKGIREYYLNFLRAGNENKNWLALANSKAKLTLSRCSGSEKTQNVPCLGDGSQVYLRVKTDASRYSFVSCGSGSINHVRLIPISEDVKFTDKEKNDIKLIRAKLYQLRDNADRKPTAEPNMMAVGGCNSRSSRTTAAPHDKWEKKAEDCMCITCPGCKKRGYSMQISTNVGLSRQRLFPRKGQRRKYSARYSPRK